MTISHPTSVQNAAADAVVDSVDAGTIDTAGDLQVLDGTTVLAEIALQDPAFGAAASGEASLQGTPLSNTASNSGTADGFKVRDKDNNEVFSGSAGQKYAITGVSTANNTFDVDTDLTSSLSPGDIIRVSGSTGNDGKYTVYSVSFTSPTSTIEVVENVSDSTADGDLHEADLTLDNTSINSGQTVQIDSLTYDVFK